MCDLVLEIEKVNNGGIHKNVIIIFLDTGQGKVIGIIEALLSPSL